MIPQYIQKQNELRPQYEHIKEVGKQLNDLRTEYNIKKIKQMKPEMVTSFMPLRGSRAKEYEEIREIVRDKRATLYPMRKRPTRPKNDTFSSYATPQGTIETLEDPSIADCNEP